MLAVTIAILAMFSHIGAQRGDFIPNNSSGETVHGGKLS